jgi:5'-nucleotidase
MAWSPGDSLVIGISSRALFDLDEEDRVYRTEGTDAFIAYQRAHEAQVIQPGVAFGLVSALLGLNGRLGSPGMPAIEVVVVSKNHPDCGVRMVRSLAHHGINVKRAVFTGGQDLLPYLRALEVDLFLSKEEGAVRDALAAGISAGLIYGGPSKPAQCKGVPVLAFDGDAVLFSDEADRVYRETNLAGFAASELKNASIPLAAGPLRRFAEALEELRTAYPIDSPPFRIALVTARDLTYSERPMQTLRAWGIRIDQGFFVSDMSKSVVLAALKPLIVFDDSTKNCADACVSTPTVQIPLLEPFPTLCPVPTLTVGDRSLQFTTVCRLFLKKTYGQHEATLLQWHEDHLGSMSDESFTGYVSELERSVTATPRGRQRRAAGTNNEDIKKLLLFLENLLNKHQQQ